MILTRGPWSPGGRCTGQVQGSHSWGLDCEFVRDGIASERAKKGWSMKTQHDSSSGIFLVLYFLC